MQDPTAKKKNTPTVEAVVLSEYSEVNKNFRELASTRFRLLSFVPALVALATTGLTVLLKSEGDGPLVTPGVVLVLSGIGLVVVLGIVFYDQRNTQLYDALVRRAKFLEEEHLRLPHDENAFRIDPGKGGGQFRERPPRSRHLLGLLKMGHDTGLALIYAPVLGAWFFPLTVSLLLILADRPDAASPPNYIAGAGAAAVATAVFLVDFIRLDEWEEKQQRRKPRESASMAPNETPAADAEDSAAE